MREAKSKPAQRTFSEPLMLLLLVAIALPPLYVLSCGPLALLEDRIGGNWWDTLFAPLEWLYTRWPAIQPWLDRYLQWWTE